MASLKEPLVTGGAPSDTGMRRRWIQPIMDKAANQMIMPLPDETGPAASARRTLGTFDGVFVPVVNSIFGVVLFLRWGWAVGQLGVMGAVLLLLLGSTISLITCAATSAMATNGEVDIGGPYYLMSRALGPEFGGAIGLLFYLASSFAVGFYVLGFAETVEKILTPASREYLPCALSWVACDGEFYWDKIAISSAVLLLLLAICLVGAQAFAKVSSVIFFVVVISVFTGLGGIVYFSVRGPEKYPNLPPGFKGLSWGLLANNTWINTRCRTFDCQDMADPLEECDAELLLTKGCSGITIFYVVGVIMPAVTGLLGGANMSGNLVDPGYSIPAGTFYGVVCMVIVYSLCIILPGASFERAELQSNYFVLQEIALWPPLVQVGTFCATFSPALATLAGMSRILQAQANDQLFGRRLSAVLALQFGAKDEPRIAIVVSWFLAQCVCMLGEVNVVAGFVTIAFFSTYAALNFACALLLITGVPNFRPLFKLYSTWLFVFGFFLCVVTTWLVDPPRAGLAYLAAVIFFVCFSVGGVGGGKFADVSQALIYQFVHYYLQRMDIRAATHVKFWRPQLLVVLSGNPAMDVPLVEVGESLRSTGLIVVGRVLQGQPGAGPLAVPASPRTPGEDSARPGGLLNVEGDEVENNVQAPAVETLPRVRASEVDRALAALIDNTLPAACMMKHRRSVQQRFLSTSSFSASIEDGIKPTTSTSSSSGDGVKAFPVVTIAPDLATGVQSMLLCCGMGSLRPNTLLLPFEDKSCNPLFGHLHLEHTLRAAAALRRSAVLARGFDPLWKERVMESVFPQGVPPMVDFRIDIAKHGPRMGLTVDVWLIALRMDEEEADSQQAQDSFESRVMVLLQLAFLLHKHPFWLRCTRLRVLFLSAGGIDGEKQTARLKSMMAASRIEADVVEVDFSRALSENYEAGTIPDSAKSRKHSVNSLGTEAYTSMTLMERAEFVNRLVQSKSQRTGLVMLYATPFARSATSQAARPVVANGTSPGKRVVISSLNLLRVLSDGLPPTLLVFPSCEAVTTDQL